jgi:hypothetical protein
MLTVRGSRHFPCQISLGPLWTSSPHENCILSFCSPHAAPQRTRCTLSHRCVQMFRNSALGACSSEHIHRIRWIFSNKGNICLTGSRSADSNMAWGNSKSVAKRSSGGRTGQKQARGSNAAETSGTASPVLSDGFLEPSSQNPDERDSFSKPGSAPRSPERSNRSACPSPPLCARPGTQPEGHDGSTKSISSVSSSPDHLSKLVLPKPAVASRDPAQSANDDAFGSFCSDEGQRHCLESSARLGDPRKRDRDSGKDRTQEGEKEAAREESKRLRSSSREGCVRLRRLEGRDGSNKRDDQDDDEREAGGLLAGIIPRKDQICVKGDYIPWFHSRFMVNRTRCHWHQKYYCACVFIPFAPLELLSFFFSRRNAGPHFRGTQRCYASTHLTICVFPQRAVPIPRKQRLGDLKLILQMEVRSFHVYSCNIAHVFPHAHGPPPHLLRYLHGTRTALGNGYTISLRCIISVVLRWERRNHHTHSTFCVYVLVCVYLLSTLAMCVCVCCCLQKELGIEAAPKPRPVREKRPKKSMEEDDDEDDEEEQDEDTWAE